MTSAGGMVTSPAPRRWDAAAEVRLVPVGCVPADAGPVGVEVDDDGIEGSEGSGGSDGPGADADPLPPPRSPARTSGDAFVPQTSQ
jgi:hypothetical protein